MVSLSEKPEYESVEVFAEFLMEDERTTFDHNDLAELGAVTHRPRRNIRKELESYGFKLARRDVERRVRTISTSSQDRWFGPGSCPTHAGSGWSQIIGFADDKKCEGT